MLIIGSILLLLANAVTLRREKSILFNRVAILILLYSGILGYDSLTIGSLDTGVGVFSGLFHSTLITHSFDIFIYIIGAVILQLTSFYPRRLRTVKLTTERSEQINKNEQFHITEYPLVILFIFIGATFLMSSSDLVSMFIAIELQSYGLYILATLYRNSELSTTAGLTYFLLGGLSSGFILLGSSLLYINSGLTNLDGIYVLASLSDENKGVEAVTFIIDNGFIKTMNVNSQSFNLALLIMSIGYLFKVSAAPFHFWSPDVYDALGTIVTTFVAILPKISLFIFLLELVNYATPSAVEFSWSYIFLVSSLLSLILGTVVGLVQRRIKRLLAYSSISHVGFILLALAGGNQESLSAFFFYLMQYSVSNVNIFFIIILIGYSLIYNKSDSNLLDEKNSPLQLIKQLKGYYHLNPMLSLSFTITLFSFMGIPPLIGFVGKQQVLYAALSQGFYFLAILAVLTSVVGGVYYLNIVKMMFFDKPELTENTSDSFLAEQSNSYTSSSLTVPISVLTLVILLFMISPTEWLSMTSILALSLINP